MRVTEQWTTYARSLAGQGLVALALLLCVRNAGGPRTGAVADRSSPPTGAGVAPAQSLLLYSDPFDASVVTSGSANTTSIAADVAARTRTAAAQALVTEAALPFVRVIAMHAASGDSESDVEGRARSRRATTGALTALGYHPDPQDSLRFAPLAADGRVLYRREWFVSARGTSAPPIVVVWLDESSIEGAFVATWSQLVGAVDQAVGAQQRVEFTIVGPTSSGALVSLLAERHPDGGLAFEPQPPEIARDRLAAGSRVSILSPFATARIEQLADDTVFLVELGGARTAYLQRVIGDDDWLVQIALDELVLRAPQLRARTTLPLREPEHWLSPLRVFGALARGLRGRRAATAKLVVLFPPESEYSRRMVDSLERVAALWNAEAERSGGIFVRIERLIAPSQIAGRGVAHSRASTREVTASGEHQLDSLEQLARQVERREDVCAYILAHWDVADRLAIMERLRATSPEPVFLTFDLDARLAERRNAASARNLVVVSHFGLELPPRTAAHFGLESSLSPAFRDIYQLATYCSVLAAATGKSPPTPYCSINEIGRERCYEVARKGLDRSADAVREEGGAAQVKAGAMLASLVPFGMRLALVLLGAIALSVASRARRSKALSRAADANGVAPRDPIGFAAGHALLALAILTGVDLFEHWPVFRAELVDLGLGASILPTLALRLTLIVAAPLCIAFSVARRRAIRRVLDKQPPVGKAAAQSTCAVTSECLALAPSERDGRLDRVEWFALAGLALAAALLLAFTPAAPESPPVRGEQLYVLERLSYFLALAACWSATFYVAWIAWRLFRVRRALRFAAAQARFSSKRESKRESAGRHIARFQAVRCTLEQTAHVPVIVLWSSLLVLANANFFDDWRQPALALSTVAIAAVAGVVADLAIWDSAGVARQHALEPLQSRLIDGSFVDDNERRRVETQAHELEQLTSGALGPVAARPVLCTVAATLVVGAFFYLAGDDALARLSTML